MNLTDPIFADADKAREHLEATRWPHGPICPHCGVVDQATAISGEGKKARVGAYQCNACRKQFSVTVGTVFEDSKVPLNKWLLASYLMASSKKGISAHQLHRTLGVTYKTAWFMCHRLREAMVSPDTTKFGGNGGVVEVDETFIGKNPDVKPTKLASTSMNKVLTLVDRSTGRARSMVVTDFKLTTIEPILFANVRHDTRLMTDEAKHYIRPGRSFMDHQSVNHSKDEYVRRQDHSITTNTVEGFFGIFKRGMTGVYQHCGSQHLQRYLVEFDFRYTNRIANSVDDTMRSDELLRGIGGKRLTYRRTGESAHA
ncbi:MAG TPA: IS1595 family transposase [Caulobacteraceae bacterium]|jgi:transposase-like protein